MKYCNKCGNELNDEAKFCTKCGSPVEELKETDEEYYEEDYKEEHKVSKGKIIAIVAIIIVLILGAVGVGVIGTVGVGVAGTVGVGVGAGVVEGTTGISLPGLASSIAEPILSAPSLLPSLSPYVIWITLVKEPEPIVIVILLQLLTEIIVIKVNELLPITIVVRLGALMITTAIESELKRRVDSEYEPVKQLLPIFNTSNDELLILRE